MSAKIYVKKQNINIWELPRLLLVVRLKWILGVVFSLFLAARESRKNKIKNRNPF